MPKTSKRKKYNARFPPARIKKIMQTDEEVGKVAAAVPVIISRALELFIESLITETSQTTLAKNAKTLSTTHIKQTIESKKQFDFLRDLVSTLPDHQTEDNTGDNSHLNGDGAAKKGRGRPKKQKDPSNAKATKGESSKPSSDTSEEEDDDEETETDEEKEDITVPSTSTAAPSTSLSVPSSQNERLCPSGQSTVTPPVSAKTETKIENISMPKLPQETTGIVPAPTHHSSLADSKPMSSSAATAQQILQPFPTIPMLPASAFPPYTSHALAHPMQPYSCSVLPPQIPVPFPTMTMPSQMSLPPMPSQHPTNCIGGQNQQPTVNSAVLPLPSVNLSCPAQAGCSQAPITAVEDDDYDT